MQDPIVQVGDPVLHVVAQPVAKADIGSPKLKRIISKMKKVLADEEYGVALAAPQVGESLRLFVVAAKVFEESNEMDGGAPSASALKTERISSKKSAYPESARSTDRVFINPELKRLSRKKAELSEGCLSVRGKYGTVMRHEKASINALDEGGNPVHYNATGLLAHIFQHECDHLDGILYIDKAVKLEEDEDLKSARVKLKEKHGV